MRSQTFWGLAVAILSITCRGVAAEECYRRRFDMVQAGLDNEVAASPDTPQQGLIDNLFGPEAPDVPTALTIKTAIYNRFRGLIKLNNKFDSNDQLEPGVETNNVKIYCDERRLKIRKRNPLQSFDNDAQEVKASGDCLKNVAWSGQTERSFAQIQICPKLIKRILVDDFKATAAFKPTFFAKMTASFLTLVGKIGYTPIDMIQLGDKVLLHELTHLNVGGKTADVGGFFNAYGWKNCRKLSTVTVDRVTKGPQNNADTWALYGSVSLMIQNDQKTVDKDTGNVIAIPGAATTRDLEAIKAFGGYWKKFVA